MSTELTDAEKAMLDLERRWWKYPGAKDSTIYELFGLQPVTYYRSLNALIDRPEALAYDPLLVRRLFRLRDGRQRQRSARRLAEIELDG